MATLAIIGDGSVGKSTIISAFRSEGFLPVYKQTIGCDFYEKTLQIREKTVSLRVWDIGGQSIHSKNLEHYLQNSTAIFLVYDVTNAESFSNLEDWLTKVRQLSAARFIYLIGNKVDLISLRLVPQSQHEKLIEDNSLSGGMFVSAKTGENVVKMFYKVSGELVGINLTSSELEYHDQVLKAFVQKEEISEGRTTFADDIEKEDMELERKKRERESASSTPCQCAIS